MAIKEKMKNKNHRIIRHALGYTVTGLAAYIFGMVWTLVRSGSFNFEGMLAEYYTFILFVIPITFLFSYVYCFCISAQKDDSIYDNKAFLKTRQIIWHFVYLFLIVMIFINIYPRSLSSSIVCGLLIYTIAYFALFMFSQWIYQRRAIGKQLRRLTLLYPSFIMITVNIYFGASIPLVLKGDQTYYIGMGILIAYSVLVLLVSFIKIDQREKNRRVFNAFNSSMLFLFIVCYACAKIFSTPDQYSVLFDILFLSIFGGLYLSIFEGWYWIKKIRENYIEMDNHCLTEEHASTIKKYSDWITYIMIAFPVIVVGFYPLQNFGWFYILCFLLGHSVATGLWLYIIPNYPKADKYLNYIRTLLGILVFFALIFDSADVLKIQTDLSNFPAVFFGLAAVAIALLNLVLKKSPIKINKNNITRFVFAMGIVLGLVLAGYLIVYSVCKTIFVNKMTYALWCLAIFIFEYVFVIRSYNRISPQNVDENTDLSA